MSAQGTEAPRLYSRFSKELGLFVIMSVQDERIVSVSLSEEEPKGLSGRHRYLDRVIDHLATGRDDLRDLPLDLPFSGFDLEVLELMRTIPPGEVMTYGEMARRLGRPNAARAVGNACAKNPAVIVVPCHRVVPSTGGVGHYSTVGGPRTKVRLLEIEGAKYKK